MDSVVAFIERFATEFTWKRVVLLVTLLAIGIAGIWIFEEFTGYFRSSRMKFAAEHLKTLSDPELKKNVEGDPELAKSHKRLKEDLNDFLLQSQIDVGVPELLWKGGSAFIVWSLLGFVMFLVQPNQFNRGFVAGFFVIAILCAFVAAAIPTFSSRWLNYALVPIGSVVLMLLLGLILGRRSRKPQS